MLINTAEVERISRIDNAILRNLNITQYYWELSKAFSSRTGVNANWCTFATWASKQAGVSIRGEDIRRAIENALLVDPVIQPILSELSSHAASLGDAASAAQLRVTVINRLILAAITKTSDAVARGNKKVFEEIGYVFAKFLTTCFPDQSYDATSIGNFCSQLREGDPPQGQQYLRRAFTRYYDSFFEQDEKKRQELCLFANIEIGFHEQTRLQPEIAESLTDALVDGEEIKEFVADLLFTRLGAWGKILYGIALLRGRKSILNSTIDRLVAAVQLRIRSFISADFMTLTLPPNNCLRLGKDLIATFPEGLQQLSNRDLVAFLSTIDPTADSVLQTGASDWSDLKERLHYIADLFRCYHSSADLFLPAFTQSQLVELRAGRVPSGRL